MRPRTAHPLRGPPSTLSDVMKLGFFQQVRLLVASGVNLECRDVQGRTPIIHCAFLEPEDWGTSIAMTLLEHGARVWRRDKSGRNALHYACIYEREGLVRVLLGAIDFDLNQTDKAGNTALHYAAMSGNTAITHLIAHAFRRYQINQVKVNHHGRTPLEEAFHTGNGGCARVIEQEIALKRPGSAMKDVRFADEVQTTAQTRSEPSLTPITPKRITSALRPSSAVAFLTRRDSMSSVNSTEDRTASASYRSRSALSLLNNGYNRKSQNPLYANGYRRDEEVIWCAPGNDFRNKPDYVFKMVHLPFHPEEVRPEILRDTTNCPSSAWGEASSTCQSLSTVAFTDWRREFKLLYQVYENQCSPSWRAGKASPRASIEHDPSCPGPGDDSEELKGRRGRRASVVSGSSGGHLRRRMSISRLKRLPSTGKSPMDGALDTSSESINSLASNKRRGHDKEAGHGGSSGKSPSSSPSPSSSRRGSTDRGRRGSTDKSARRGSADKGTRRGSADKGSPPRRSSIKNSKDLQKIASAIASVRRGSGTKASLKIPSRPKTAEKNATKTSGEENGAKLPLPIVKETLVSSPKPETNGHVNIDTNRLSVPNLYDDDDDDDDNDNDDDHCVEVLH